MATISRDVPSIYLFSASRNVSTYEYFVRDLFHISICFPGRVCIPIDPNKAESFDPFSVPTISQLADEIDKFAKEEGKHKRVTEDYKKTSLREPMNVFNAFLSGLGETWKGKRIEASDSKMEF